MEAARESNHQQQELEYHMQQQLENIVSDDTSQFVISIYFFWASALFLILVFTGKPH